jgi:cobalt-zinc-cadmium efflux system membrane fusion protein
MRAWHCLLVMGLLAGCQKQETAGAQQPAGEEPHAESVTNWTAKTELFAEYMPLIAGQSRRFAVHLTRLDTFRPLAKARVEIRLAAGDGKVAAFAVDGPSRPGIFGVDVKPAVAGEFRVSVVIVGEGIEDEHDLGLMEVTATKAAALHEHGPDTEQKVAFLKEQQWTLEFATAVVEDRQLRGSLQVPAEVLPRSGGEAEVRAPFDGRLAPGAFPVAGTRVTQGQVLASIMPPLSAPGDGSLLELARNESALALALARKDRARAERLVEAGAAPAKRLEEARTAEAMAEARVQSAEARLRQFEVSSASEAAPQGARLFVMRAPITGVIEQMHAAPGANVTSGAVLFKIVDVDTVTVSAIVPEADYPKMRQLTGAELGVPGQTTMRVLGPPILVGRMVDATSRTFPVVYQVDNRDRGLAIHQAVTVRLLMQASAMAPAVPESALVDDGGRPVIFVQSSGEGFIRRPVSLGMREGGYVEIMDGVIPGERVVTRGAHLVRLATMSNQVPAHGHVH